jgi:hypothetical protein
MTIMDELVDSDGQVPALIFDQLVTEWPELFVPESKILELTQLPDPWQWEWETPLRAQMRVLSGRPDVTAWTTDAGTALAAVLKSPTGMHRSLLGLGDETDVQPPTVASGASEPSAVSADGDEGAATL